MKYNYFVKQAFRIILFRLKDIKNPNKEEIL